MRCFGYVRVSTEQQAGEVRTSLGDQQTAIMALAERLGATVERWYRDEGASGATAAKRPAFARLLADCEAGKGRDVGVVLALNDSRWGRFPDPEEAAYWRHHLRRLGWTVRYCENDDTDNKTTGTVMRAIGSAQASEYRDAIRRNARRGARGTVEQGFWGCRAPIGYRRAVVYPPGRERVLDESVPKAPDEKIKLTPHEVEACHVRWAYEQYAGGLLSVRQLVGRLKHRLPGRKWSHRTAQAMLQNPAYCGDVIGGRRPVADDGVQKTVRPQSEWYGVRDAHPAIVPREVWDAVQRRLSYNANRGRAVRATYLLSGLLTCTHCGDKYVGGGGGKDRKFYKCSGGIEGHCAGRIGTVMRWMVDEAVVETLARTLTDKRVQRMVAAELDRQLAAPTTTDAGALRVERKRLADRRDRLVRAIATGLLLDEEAAGEMEAVRSALAALDARQHAARFQARRRDAASVERDRLLSVLADFPRAVRRLEGPALRELVVPWLAGATFDKATRELTLSIRAVGVVQLAHSPGQDDRKKVLVRRVSLAALRYGGERKRRAG
jgi:DNA invertase Pin-like site-specific DNA recombinase